MDTNKSYVRTISSSEHRPVRSPGPDPDSWRGGPCQAEEWSVSSEHHAGWCPHSSQSPGVPHEGASGGPQPPRGPGGLAPCVLRDGGGDDEVRIMLRPFRTR